MKTMKKQSTVRRLFGCLRDQRVRLTVVVISIIIYVGLSIWNPMYSAIVIDHLWESIQAAWKNQTAFAISWNNMGRELLQLTLQYLFTWIFYYLQSYLMANVAENLVLNLRTQVAEKLNRLPLRFFDQNKAGEILSRVTSDLDKINGRNVIKAYNIRSFWRKKARMRPCITASLNNWLPFTVTLLAGSLKKTANLGYKSIWYSAIMI